MEMPSGTVTFLFTDMEGSTRHWEAETETMRTVVALHDELVRAAVDGHHGAVFAAGGDGFAVAFALPGEALTCALAVQDAVREAALPAVRMGIHTGVADERDGNYFGPTLNRAARLMGIGHGGQILVSRATEQLVRDSLGRGMALVDLGEHRLRDLSRPERVFQLGGPALRASFPPLRSLDHYPTNLPLQMTAFVGRDDDQRDAIRALAEHRVVTLTGVGGVGKTRLAFQVGAEVLSEFGDGVFAVELGGISDPSAIDESVAVSLAVRQQPGQSIADGLLSFLSNKRMLVVLDNCEHLLEPISQFVTLVLGIAPNVRVLATSRESLRVDGEQVISVPSLPVPDVHDRQESIAETDAVRLFVERARAIRSDFELTDDNAAAVAHLCRRLDGIPLAIELAAARVRSMAPHEIAARLDQRFRLLTGGARSSVDRHQTLQRAIDWSYELLEPVERTVLGRLAVCAGGFDLSAAEAIAVGDGVDAFDVDDIVGRLVDKSLVLAADLGDLTRFKMLETVRDYALERLEASGELEHVRTIHASCYSDFAHAASEGLKGPEERAWLTRVEEELDNLRAAVSWALVSDSAHLAVACVCALGLQGLRIEPVVGSWAHSIIASGVARDTPGYAAVLGVAAWATMAEGRLDDAQHLADAAIELLDNAPPAVECQTLSPLAGMEPMSGRSPIPHAQRWLDAAKIADDLYGQALALSLLAVGQHMNGESAAAIVTAEASLAAARACGSPSCIAYCSFSLALVVTEADPSRALELLDESRRYAQAAANDYALMTGAGVRTTLLSQSGDHPAAARASYEMALDAARAGRRNHQAVALACFAGSLAADGQPEEAAVMLGWTESVLGTADPSLNLNLGKDARKALLNLQYELGPDRHDVLTAEGAAMTAEAALEYARRQSPQPTVQN